MSKKAPSGWMAAVIGGGIVLHQIHQAIEGYEWLAQFCWCRFRRRAT
jgi:hypothetical protein